jgi:hypothetical protein
MARRRYTSNVARDERIDQVWLERTLMANWEALEQRVPAKLMPVTDPQTRREYWIEGDTDICGHYGCVYPTRTKGIVCKVTTDKAEAAFVSAALDIGRFPDGIVEYQGAYELVAPGKTRVFALWREEASVVGQKAAFHVAALMAGKGKFRGAPGRTLEILSATRMMGTWLNYALRHTADPEGLVKAAAAVRKDIWSHVSLDDVVAVSRAGFVRGFGPPPLEFAIGVAAFDQLLSYLAESPLGAPIGEAMRFYMKHGMLLADVHDENIGAVARDGGLALAITDPGDMIPLTAERFHVEIKRL